jgi:DNA-binding CsgD family transcriptional regulator
LGTTGQLLSASALAEPTSNLSTKDCAQLLRVTSELYLLSDLAQLPATVLRTIGTLVPHERGGCHVVEPARQQICAFYEPALPEIPALGKSPWQMWEGHPLQAVVFSQPTRAWRRSDVISRRTFPNPLELDHELGAATPAPGKEGEYILICLQRSGTDFTERERTILGLLLPHIAQARQRLCIAADRSVSAPKEPVQFRQWIRHRTRWELTPRESEVLFWLCQGKTNAEIGRILGIAERTAETHALRIYPKMGVENRYTAIATMTRLSAGQE